MKMTTGKKVIVLFNKSDLDPVLNINDIEQMMMTFGHRKEDIRFLKISTKEKMGIDIFEETVKNMFLKGEIEIKDEVMITNLRQKEAVSDTIESLKLVLNSINNQMPEDFLTIDLMNAYESLGKIIGEEIGEDLINEIFSRFCMGK